MSMTREEALKLLEYPIYKWSMDWDEREDGLDYAEAIEIAIAALRHQIWEEQLWHDAKTDPPKTPGVYYGKKDDTNSMYACRYRDGVWVLDAYPQQKMDIVQWADYTAFARENEEIALRPVSREQVEKVWRGEWIKDTPLGHRCKSCGCLVVGQTNFCPNCGAPTTDEAVQMVIERMEALHENRD